PRGSAPSGGPSEPGGRRDGRAPCDRCRERARARCLGRAGDRPEASARASVPDVGDRQHRAANDATRRPPAPALLPRAGAEAAMTLVPRPGALGARTRRFPEPLCLASCLALALAITGPVSAQGTPTPQPGKAPRLTIPEPSTPPLPPAAGRPSPTAQGTHAKGGAPLSSAGAPPQAPVTGVPGEVQVTPERVRIGDRIRLLASYGAPGAWTAVPGEDLKPGEKLGPFRILASDASHPGALILDLGPDETGALTVPAFSLAFRHARRTSMPVAIPSARVTVASVIGEGDSTAIVDLKPPAELPVPWPWAILATLGAAVLLAAAATWWLARYLKRERAPKPRPEIALPPGMTPQAC